MCVYIHTHERAHVGGGYVYVFVFVSVFVVVSVRVCMYVCMHMVELRLRLYLCDACVCVCVCVWVNVMSYFANVHLCGSCKRAMHACGSRMRVKALAHASVATSMHAYHDVMLPCTYLFCRYACMYEIICIYAVQACPPCVRIASKQYKHACMHAYEHARMCQGVA